MALCGENNTCAFNEVTFPALGVGDFGISISGQIAFIATGNLVIGNTIRGAYLDGVGISDYSARNVVKRNYILDCCVGNQSPSFLSGVRVYGTGVSDNIVKDNTIINNAGMGMLYDVSEHASATGTVVRNNTTKGVTAGPLNSTSGTAKETRRISNG